MKMIYSKDKSGIITTFGGPDEDDKIDKHAEVLMGLYPELEIWTYSVDVVPPQDKRELIEGRFFVTLTIKKSTVVEAPTKEDACALVLEATGAVDYEYRKESIDAEELYKINR